MEFIFLLLVLIFSVVIHEVSHGYAARSQGDYTAEYAGRLTLNPLAHLDPIGSILVPFFTYAVGGVVFGWAKPVPYNPFALKNMRWGPALVALAGPAANFILALLFGAFIRIIGGLGLLGAEIITLFAMIVRINLLLGIFNLLPIPPLDGSKLLFAVLPESWMEFKIFLERYGFIFLMLFIVFGFQLITPLINALFRLIIGSGL